MGSITFQVFGDGTVGTKTKTYTVSDADINRLVAYGIKLATTPQLPNPTVAQGLLAWVDRAMAVAKADVLSSERDTATVGITQISAI